MFSIPTKSSTTLLLPAKDVRPPKNQTGSIQELCCAYTTGADLSIVQLHLGWFPAELHTSVLVPPSKKESSTRARVGPFAFKTALASRSCPPATDVAWPIRVMSETEVDPSKLLID